MSATVTIDAGGRGTQDNKYVRRGSVTFGTYATNGVAITRGQFDMNVTLDDLDVRPAGGYVAEFDKANLKVKLYRQKDPGNAGGADIVLPEVANGVDVSATPFRFYAVGV